MSLERLFSIMRKEVIQIVRDRRTLITIFTLPVIQLLLYGYLSNEVTHLPTVVLDQSRTTESRELIQIFENTRYFSVRRYVDDPAEIQRQIDAGHAKVGIVIPPDYGRALEAGRPAVVQVVVDASDPTSARTVLSVAAGAGQSISAGINVRTIERAGARVPDRPPVEVRTRAWYNPNLQSVVFIVPGVLAIILQFTLTFLSVAVIVRERELGTLEQIVVTPIQNTELMLGKVIPLIGLGYINMTIILVLASVWFHMPIKGSLLLLYVLSLAFLFSALGFGVLISASARTFQQALQVAQLVLLPSILISGFLFPRESLPWGLQLVGYALPLTYFIDVVRGIVVKGVGVEDLWDRILPLLGLGLLMFVLAIRRFQKKID